MNEHCLAVFFCVASNLAGARVVAKAVITYWLRCCFEIVDLAAHSVRLAKLPADLTADACRIGANEPKFKKPRSKHVLCFPEGGKVLLSGSLVWSDTQTRGARCIDFSGTEALETENNMYPFGQSAEVSQGDYSSLPEKFQIPLKLRHFSLN